MPRPINRDPSRPRGHMSAYAFFVQDRRGMYRSQSQKVDFATFSKECATLWKSMTEDQRLGYQQLAEHDKIRYRTEMDKYKGRLVAMSGVKKRGRKKKQPGEPKRNMCAFLFFCSEKRPQLKAQTPGASVGDLAKQLAAAWKSMNADQKRPYEIMAERDKERYDQQKSAYIAGFQASKMQQELAGAASSSQSASNFNPTTSAAMTLPIVPGMPSLPQISQQVTIPAAGGSTMVGLSTSRGKKKKDPNMPKRSMSGFMFFSLEKRPQLRVQSQRATVGELSKQLSALWSELTPEQKLPYDQAARRDKERYERQMAEFRSGRFNTCVPIHPGAVMVNLPGDPTTVDEAPPDVDLHHDQVVTVSTVTQGLQIPTTQGQHLDTDASDQLYQYMYQPDKLT